VFSALEICIAERHSAVTTVWVPTELGQLLDSPLDPLAVAER
jgi:hypothetical protein